MKRSFRRCSARCAAETCAREGIPVRVEGAAEATYSVYRKLKRQRIPLDQVYDLMALRIITDSVKNCYAALGVIHNEWHPIPGRIKDFIAIPRPNLYQSLHTSVMGPNGMAFEVQIRTEEMHRIAEEGIAAHWKYKEGKQDSRLTISASRGCGRLVEWQREMRDPGEFMSTLKVDLYPEEVYAFTPLGRVVVLPRGASPIDFAYAIHTDVGHTCVGAKVNGRIVPLKTALKNGDVVEILTQTGHVPSKDWLSIVKTSRARNKIKHVINATERERAIDIGQKYLDKEARRLGVAMSRVQRAELERVASTYGFSKIEDLHAALGYGRYSARQVLHNLAPDQVPEKEATPSPTDGAKPPADAPVAPRDGQRRRSGHSCQRDRRSPRLQGEVLQPDSRGIHRGVRHSRQGCRRAFDNCANVQNLMYEVERKIDVEWARAASENFPVRMVIYTDDRPGMLNQLTSVLFHENSNIRSLEARSDDKRGGDGAIVEMTVEVKDKRQLEKVTGSMRRIAGVRDIERVQ